MFKIRSRKEEKIKRHKKIRNKIGGTTEKPRLTVFKSLKYIYAQIIDDETRATLVSASSMEEEFKSKLKNAANVEAAKLVGETIAKRAKAANIEEVVFDRSGYIYHGKVKALAEAVREGGLKC